MYTPDNSTPQSREEHSRIKEAINGLSAQTIVIIAVCALLVAGVIGAAAIWPVARNTAIAADVVQKTADADAGYRKASDDYEQMKQKYDDAVDTVAEADNIKSGMRDLQSQHDDLEQQVADAQAQLDDLTGKVKTAEKNSVGDGVWQVGTDINAGTYRATDAVPEDCYWAVYVNGDIVDNDIPQGGYPEVTVSNGQQLKLSSCGTFSKK